MLRRDPPDYKWALADYSTGDAILDLTPDAVEDVTYRIFTDFDRWYAERNTHPVQRLRIINNSDDLQERYLPGIYDMSGIMVYVCENVNLLTDSGTLWDLLQVE